MVRKKSIDFTEPQFQWLTREAKRMGVSIAELVRRLIDNARGA